MNTHFTEKTVVLGYTGYVGEAFATELLSRGESHVCLSRRELDYTKFNELRSYLATARPTFLINCAGFTGKPNVDACESSKADTIAGNVVLPVTIANACEACCIPWGQVSSGCIYAGGKIADATGAFRVEKDLMKPTVRSEWERKPNSLLGFTEDDDPNFSFRNPPCSFYSGTKALGEEQLIDRENLFIWRLRIPFDQFDGPRNYLSKLQRYEYIYDNVNSLSHRGEFAKACLDLRKLRAPTGTYNVTNPGWVTTRQVANAIEKKIKLKSSFKYFENDSQFYQIAKTPRSNTVLESTKLVSAGVQMRNVWDAIEQCLTNWTIGW